MGFRKKIKLGDGRKIIIREPTVGEDLENLVGFLTSIPAELRNYLRYNVTESEFCRKRLEQIDSKNHWRLIAMSEGKIIGDATMDREPFGWTRHVAELRGVIDPQKHPMTILPILFNELISLGSISGIELLFTEVMEEQREWIRELEKIGFKREAVRKRYAKDLKGNLHNVVVMANDLEGLWNQLANLLEEMDGGRYQEI